MKIVLGVGLFIVFLTTIFILFIGTALINKTIVCDQIGVDSVDCRLESYTVEMLISFFMVLAFIMVDVGAVYLMITTWKA